MHKTHILVVDDDQRIRSLLGKYLSNNGYMVTSAKDTEEAREALELFKFDLIILDIMLPNQLGTDFAIELRKTSQIAILMLTAMGDVKERIKGLEAGADDYLAKPFEPKELLLRIEKLLQRTKYYNERSDSHISIGKIKYDTSKNVLLDNDHVIMLGGCEMKLLDLLIENRGHAISRDELAESLNINPRSIDVQVTRLRNKIENDPKKPIFLQTVRGKGYILYADK